jgi:UPF0755 protein
MIKKTKKRKINKLSLLSGWKPLIIAFVVAFFIFSGSVYHYGFELRDLANLSFYQNLANPSMKMVSVPEGLRKEEVVEVIAKKLNWDESEKQEFLNAHLAYAQDSLEGRYFPKSYMIDKDSDPVVVSKTMTDEYRKKLANVKKNKATKILNEDTALIVASLIQREAGGKSDMRLISGIIWNRIFAGMKLQIDATLQYAKGDEDLWWPMVYSKDKKIDSLFNTYMYSMPPGPIASPGISALEAAYNPQKTSCLFYLHDKKRNIHCSRTYEEHKRNIEKYL